MEIIHLILGKANPERMNGVNKVVHEMATNQVQRGYLVQVWGITPKPVHDYPDRIFTTRLYQSQKSPFGVDPKLFADFLAKKKSNIVVHMHGAFIPVFYSVSGFLVKHKIPFIITPHSTYNKVMMKKNALIKKVYFKMFEKKLLNRCASIHLLGVSEWEGLDEIYDNKKSVLIPYGFSIPAASNDLAKKRGLFTVVYCGRISIYSKGLDILLNGFARFHKRRGRTRLLIIGDGKEKVKLEKMATEMGLQNIVEFTGSIYGEDKTKLIRSCHLFAHPSRTDGLPATIVEAASLGVPCIVSEATNTGEYIADYDAGYKMTELTAESLSTGLNTMYKRMMTEGGVQRLSENSQRMISEVFDWTNILKRFANIYELALVGQKDGAQSKMMGSKKEQVA